MTPSQLKVLFLIALVAVLPTLGTQSSAQQSATIGGYEKVSETRVGRTVYEYVYRATLTPAGGGMGGATATVVSVSAATTIVDNSLTFGAVAAGGAVMSTDAFTFRHDRQTPFSFANLSWRVTPTVGNLSPVADAGPDQAVTVGATVTLTAAGSSDADGDTLTYDWALVSRPAGSVANLSGTTDLMPTFVVDRAGTYEWSLRVFDGMALSGLDKVRVSTVNTAPLANAGPDQSALVGQTVTLTGAASSDADGNALTYAWSVVSSPVGSTATPSPATGLTPTVVIDRPGTYVFALAVSDGVAPPSTDTVLVSTTNTAPVANAGPDQSAAVGAGVTLNGSGSTDADGDMLTYAWSVVSTPVGSTATLMNPATLNPTFTVDMPGEYVMQLKVNDGHVDSTPDTVVISTANTPPVAHAGPDQSVVAGVTVSLDGSASSDADGDPLTYAWSFVTRPVGSIAVLVNADTPFPTFTADRPGDYVAQLTVDDGPSASSDTVTVSTTNVSPVANAGPDQSVLIGALVTLDGSLSVDANDHPLTYAWSLASRPVGSAATLANAATVTPSFTADLAGDYVAQLQVSDGFVLSGIDTVLVRATVVNRAPSFTRGTNQLVLEDAGAQTVVPWATAISPGPASEAGQTVSFNVTGNTNPAMFAAGPAVSSTGTLTFTPAANANGTAVITITLQDNGGTAGGGVDTSAPQAFTISVTPVNDAPSFTKGPNQTVLENSGAHIVAGWATAISAGPGESAQQSLSFNITSNTALALFSAGPTIAPNGTLSYTLAPNRSGLAIISVGLSDTGGTANGGQNTSAEQQFTINVTAAPLRSASPPAPIRP